MRKYDVAYVPNVPKNYYPVKELEDMTLEEIVAKHIKTCGKANGNLATCSQCKSPCKQGKRAIQLLSNKVYNDPPIPLYGGKTLIEKAREENMKRRQGSAVASLADALKEAQQKEPEKKKRQYVKWENWWDESLNSGDQLKWVMDNMKLSKTQAKKKIYMYKYNNGLLNKDTKEEIKENVKEETKEEKAEVVKVQDAPAGSNIETKIDALLKMKDAQKKAMDEYYKLYENAKKEYEKIEKKIDTLCNAMDIMNEL